jgi:hypothetical protein
MTELPEKWFPRRHGPRLVDILNFSRVPALICINRMRFADDIAFDGRIGNRRPIDRFGRDRIDRKIALVPRVNRERSAVLTQKNRESFVKECHSFARKRHQGRLLSGDFAPPDPQTTSGRARSLPWRRDASI